MESATRVYSATTCTIHTIETVWHYITGTLALFMHMSSMCSFEILRDKILTNSKLL